MKFCNSFVLVPKLNLMVELCLDPAKLNQAFIRPVHRYTTVNDILPSLTCTQYHTLIDASLGYHNLKLDIKIIIFNHNCLSV